MKAAAALGVLVLPLVLAAFATSAHGEGAPPRAEDREISFPRHGISLRVPASWSIRQYGPDLARWTSEDVDLRLRVTEKPAGEADTTEVADGSRLRRRAGVTGSGHGFEVLARTPDDDDVPRRTLVDSVLASIDLSPYPNPRVHADWKREWTIEVPDGWDLVRDAGAARIAPRAGGCVLSVDAWEDLPAAKEAPKDLAGWMALAIRLARDERIGGEPIVPTEEPEVAEIGVGAGIEARLSGFKVETESMKARGVQGWVSLLVTSKFRLQLVCDAAGAGAAKAALDAFRSFEPDVVGAGRTAAPSSDAIPTDRFPSDAGPALVFRLPSGWKPSTPTSSMRLAQYEIPGDPPAEVVVYFFGAGGGGGVQANLDRWKGQVQGEGEPKTAVLDPSDGIRVHVLDASGTYSTPAMGANPPVHIAEARLLGAVVECAGGPLFVKAVGPKKTIDEAAPAILAWLKSFRIRLP